MTTITTRRSTQPKKASFSILWLRFVVRSTHTDGLMATFFTEHHNRNVFEVNNYPPIIYNANTFVKKISRKTILSLPCHCWVLFVCLVRICFIPNKFRFDHSLTLWTRLAWPATERNPRVTSLNPIPLNFSSIPLDKVVGSRQLEVLISENDHGAEIRLFRFHGHMSLPTRHVLQTNALFVARHLRRVLALMLIEHMRHCSI